MAQDGLREVPPVGARSISEIGATERCDVRLSSDSASSDLESSHWSEAGAIRKCAGAIGNWVQVQSGSVHNCVPWGQTTDTGSVSTCAAAGRLTAAMHM